jgi:hypothetical protein
MDELRYPTRQLTFGRSQDLTTIENIEIVTVRKIDQGYLWGSLLPIELGQELPGEGIIHNLPEYFEYFDGKIRRPRNNRPFLALSQYEQMVAMPGLHNIELEDESEEIFYLHDWLNRGSN